MHGAFNVETVEGKVGRLASNVQHSFGPNIEGAVYAAIHYGLLPSPFLSCLRIPYARLPSLALRKVKSPNAPRGPLISRQVSTSFCRGLLPFLSLRHVTRAPRSSLTAQNRTAPSGDFVPLPARPRVVLHCSSAHSSTSPLLSLSRIQGGALSGCTRALTPPTLCGWGGGRCSPPCASASVVPAGSESARVFVIRFILEAVLVGPFPWFWYTVSRKCTKWGLQKWQIGGRLRRLRRL